MNHSVGTVRLRESGRRETHSKKKEMSEEKYRKPEETSDVEVKRRECGLKGLVYSVMFSYQVVSDSLRPHGL